MAARRRTVGETVDVCDGVCVRVLVGVLDGVAVTLAEAVAVCDVVPEIVCVALGVCVPVLDGVWLGVCVPDPVCVLLGVTVTAAVPDAVPDADTPREMEAVTKAVPDGVAACVSVPVSEFVAELVCDDVTVGVPEGEAVPDGVVVPTAVTDADAPLVTDAVAAGELLGVCEGVGVLELVLERVPVAEREPVPEPVALAVPVTEPVPVLVLVGDGDTVSDAVELLLGVPPGVGSGGGVADAELSAVLLGERGSCLDCAEGVPAQALDVEGALPLRAATALAASVLNVQMFGRAQQSFMAKSIWPPHVLVVSRQLTAKLTTVTVLGDVRRRRARKRVSMLALPLLAAASAGTVTQGPPSVDVATICTSLKVGEPVPVPEALLSMAARDTRSFTAKPGSEPALLIMSLPLTPNSV